MKSFVIKIKDFFPMNRGEGFGDENFLSNKRNLHIPLYQREYKWTNSKIECLVRDVALHEKFLGIIILDETDDSYEIVDGQQRITTCFLILMGIYNLYHGQQREQQNVLNLLQPYNNAFILKNHSVGDFIEIRNGQMSINISELNDIYFQKDTFTNAYNLIFRLLTPIQANNNLRDFQNKLRDCELLIMINEAHQDTQPIEQVFLDINEKSQLLDVEDIFKGHCFEIFTDDLHEELKNIWAKLKHNAIAFNRFGYGDLSQYLFHFLLFWEDRSLPVDLSPNGVHYLTNKTIDETEHLLNEMIAYGENILNFREFINDNDYRFVDICPQSHEYRNTEDHIMLKTMIQDILDSTKSLYQKAPAFILIHSLYSKQYNDLTHDVLRRLITNLYIYANLFIITKSKRKSKSDIDHTLRNSLYEQTNAIRSAITSVKSLRIASVEDFTVKSNFKQDSLEFVYSVMDNYVSNDNWLSKKYTNTSGYTFEHFIIPDNRGKKVCWIDDDSFDFIITNNNSQNYKNRTINYLILPRDLNESLGHDDVIRKIDMIEDWYEQREIQIPAHVNIFIEHVESLVTYQEIASYKGQHKTRDDIKSAYHAFIEEYFSEDRQNTLHSRLTEAFKDSFRNNVDPT